MFILFQPFIYKLLYIYLFEIILRKFLFNKIQLILTIINETKRTQNLMDITVLFSDFRYIFPMKI